MLVRNQPSLPPDSFLSSARSSNCKWLSQSKLPNLIGADTSHKRNDIHAKANCTCPSTDAAPHHSQGRNRSMASHSLVLQIGHPKQCVTNVSHMIMIEMASRQCDDKDHWMQMVSMPGICQSRDLSVVTAIISTKKGHTSTSNLLLSQFRMKQGTIQWDKATWWINSRASAVTVYHW